MAYSTKPLCASKPHLADRTTALVAVFALLLVTVTGAVSAAQFKWRVATDAPYSQVRPAVGPDGTVYAVDVFNNLIAVAPDGNELWRVANAGSKGVDVGGDGTIYTGNEDWIKAFYPDGSLKWTFEQNPRAFVLIDVAVGPDSNIYAVASSGMGVFSLADGGHGNPIFRWQTPEAYTRTFVGYTEIAFGLSTTPGCTQQLYFYANSHTRAVCLEDGSPIFSVGGGNTPPKVSPVDNTWHRGDSAYSPDGVLQWQTEFPLFAGFYEPSLAWDGTKYTVVWGDELYAIDMLGTELWAVALDEFVGLPDVDPTKSIVIMPTSFLAGPLALKAVSAEDGSALWRIEFPADVSGFIQDIDSGVAYSANGDTAYVMTFVNGANKTYLNAIGTGLNPGSTSPNPVDPTPAPVEPEPTPVEPEPTPVEPEPTPVEPEPTPVEPEPTPVEPEPTPVEPEPTPVEPEPTPVEPEPTPVEPEPTPVEPEPTPVEPEPTPVEPEPTPVEPEPTPVEPEPTPVEPEPTPVEPEPTPVEPEPTPVEPEPTPVEPEPAPTDPTPVPVITAPAPVEPEPPAVDPAPTPVDTESSSEVANQTSEDSDSDTSIEGAGSFNAAALTFLVGALAFMRLFEITPGARSRRRKSLKAVS